MNKYSWYLLLCGQLFRFGIVGLVAAIIHFSVVLFLVERWAIQPLLANVFGFLLGFQVSYWGHKLWTFKNNVASHYIALPKLAIVQSINFIANQSLFYIFLICKLPYPLALFLVLTILPIFTFISSKLWVFR